MPGVLIGRGFDQQPRVAAPVEFAQRGVEAPAVGGGVRWQGNAVRGRRAAEHEQTDALPGARELGEPGGQRRAADQLGWGARGVVALDEAGRARRGAMRRSIGGVAEYAAQVAR